MRRNGTDIQLPFTIAFHMQYPKYSAKRNSMNGSSDFTGRYRTERGPVLGAAPVELPYFGVRVNSDCWLNIASSTPRALFTDIPVARARRKGSLMKSNIQPFGFRWRCATM